MCGALAFGVAACGGDDEQLQLGLRGHRGASDSGGGDVSGKITIDGSSTVGPFAEAAAELFNEENPDVQVTVGISGTGGGFEKVCAGETDISDASREIKSDEEAPICEKNGIKYNAVQIANDGIAVATNKELAVDCMTTAQLKKLWNKGSKVTKLGRRSTRSFPDTELSLYGPGTDSGTFDFFTDAINGEEGVMPRGLRGFRGRQPARDRRLRRRGPLGYFGFSYYEGAADKLNLVGVDDGSGDCVKPSSETIQDGSYKPLSRPLFMYPSDEGDAASRGEGVPGVRRRQPGAADRRGRQDRPAHRRAGDDGEGQARQEPRAAPDPSSTWLTTQQPPPTARWGAGPASSGAPRRARASRAAVRDDAVPRGGSSRSVTTLAIVISLLERDDPLLRRRPRSATTCSGRSGRRSSPATSSPSA